MLGCGVILLGLSLDGLGSGGVAQGTRQGGGRGNGGASAAVWGPHDATPRDTASVVCIGQHQWGFSRSVE